MPKVKTLLDPLDKGQIPRQFRHIPGRHTKSYAYQDEKSRYFLATFAPQEIPPHKTDRLHYLEAGDVARPDLLAYRFYGDPAYYWIILWVNEIMDPFEQMYPGLLLRIPTQQRLAQFGVRA